MDRQYNYDHPDDWKPEDDEAAESEDELDKLIEANREFFEAMFSGNTVVVPQRLQEFYLSLSFIRKSVTGTDMEIKESLFLPEPTSGSIEILGKDLRIVDTELFQKGIALADNVDGNMMRDGKVSIGISYRGVARRLRPQKG